MQEIVLHEFDGYTMIMVSHRLEMTMRFDQVVVLDKGSVVEQLIHGKEGGVSIDISPPDMETARL